jgi:hypothetical protein
MAYDALFNAPKSLAQSPVWIRSHPEKTGLWFDVPIEIGEVVEANFTLHGECRLDLQDQNVGLELVHRSAGGYRRRSLARLDWRSIKGGHTNKKRSGWPYPIPRAPATHHHPFELNWIEGTTMRPGDLPVADGIDGELQTFESMRAMAGFLFRISNIDLVPRPPWVYTLV